MTWTRRDVEPGFFACPFCGGKISTPQDPATGTHGEVLHTMPPCKTYLDTGDALAFVKACNLEVARRRGVGLT
jgi:hypothetical protein